MSYLETAVEFADNPDPRCPCVLLLDTSTSMRGARIAGLNDGLLALERDLQGDALARRRVELAIVTFGGSVQVLQDFITADQFAAPRLNAGGGTPMGAAITTALDLLAARKTAYRDNGISYYRPWAFLITDGEPTGEWRAAAERVRAEEAGRRVAFFAVGVEDADMARLAEIAVRTPIRLRGLDFTSLFLWLSQSQKAVSASQVGDQVALPEVTGWADV